MQTKVVIVQTPEQLQAERTLARLLQDHGRLSVQLVRCMSEADREPVREALDALEQQIVVARLAAYAPSEENGPGP